MVVVKFYTVHLFVFTNFLNTSYAMVEEQPEKYYVNSVRSTRQIRPILGSIVFLLAANLVAKGALALDGNYVPTVPNNIQGALYLTLSGARPPNGQPQQQQQYLPYPLWLPIPNQVPYASGPSTTRPITQQQIISIGEPLLTDESKENIEHVNEPPHHIVIYKSNKRDVDTVLSDDLDNDDQGSDVITTTEFSPEADVETLAQNTDDSDIGDELARQAMPMNTTTANMTATTPTNVTMNETGYYYGYGYSNRTDNISITYGPPTQSNQTAVINQYLQPPAYVQSHYAPPIDGTALSIDSGYKYYPSGDYGPSNGYEDVSITQKPFVYSPLDPYLGSQNNDYQNNRYSNSFYFNQNPYGFKYNSLDRFYNKYGYNYPFFFK